MHIEIDQPALVELLSNAIRAVDSRPELPICGNFLLLADMGCLRVTGTNLAITIASSAECKIITPGAITLPARTFTDLVDTLDRRRPVTLKSDDETAKVTITCGKSVTSLNGVNADEFPPAKSVAEDFATTLPAKEFCKSLRATLYAAAAQDTRPLLAGGSIRFSKQGLALVGGDGYRVSMEKLPSILSDQDCEVVISARLLGEVEALFGESEDPLEVTIGNRLARFECGAITVFCLVLDGKSPLGLDKIATKFDSVGDVDADSLRRILKRVRILAKDNNLRVSFRFREAELSVEGISKERGEASDSLDCVFTGNPFSITMNLDYILQALDSFASVEKVMICHTEGVPALFMRSTERADLMASISQIA